MLTRLRPYLQLLRLPNLFTVPGDPLCGFLLASGGVLNWQIVPAAGFSLLAYCFGLVLNDYVDFKEDLRDRPARPLPSGAISHRAALGLMILLLCALEIIAIRIPSMRPNGATSFLLFAIVIYNGAAKKSAFLGPVFMGLCRSCSVAVGAASSGAFAQGSYQSFREALAGNPILLHGFPANQVVLRYFCGSPYAFLAAAIVGFYIMGVTALARTETRNPKIPPLIGQLIRALLFIQAAFCAVSGGPAGWYAAGVLLALWPISRLVASHFYAS